MQKPPAILPGTSNGSAIIAGKVNLKMIFNTTICGKWAGARFDQSEQSEANCKAYILGEGKPFIDNQYFKIEYVAVKKLSEAD